MYGTAWKEDKTENLVSLAIKTGFRAIDTANQRKHYFEEAVGHALKRAFDEGYKREDFFIQTKFTSIDGQDHRLPYDENAPVKTQVRQSFESSLKHLNLEHIDSYVIHGPTTHPSLAQADFDIYEEMEAIQREGKFGYLGLSNVNIKQLKLFYDTAEIKPSFVQNRCYAHLGWDQQVRAFCQENKIIYQGFSLLTANRPVLQHISQFAESMGKSPSQIIFKFSQQIGMFPLTGTSN